jgi:hypothetical protein
VPAPCSHSGQASDWGGGSGPDLSPVTKNQKHVCGGGGGEKFNRRSSEAHPTHCRVEPARVFSPQVDLTHYGLDKTPTLFILH